MKQFIIKLGVASFVAVNLSACVLPTTNAPGAAGSTPAAGSGAGPVAGVTPGIENGPVAAPTGNGQAAGGNAGNGNNAVDPNDNQNIASSCGISNMRDEMVAAVNAQRAQPRSCAGVAFPAAPPVHWSYKLALASQNHDKYLARNNSSMSVDPHSETPGLALFTGVSPWDRDAAAGFPFRSTGGENIAAGTPSVSSAVGAWMSDYGHCANIMDAIAIPKINQT